MLQAEPSGSSPVQVSNYLTNCDCSLHLAKRTADGYSKVRADILGRPRLSRADSPEAFGLIKYWLTACHDQHTECLRTFAGETVDTNDPILPTRVVEVGGLNDSHRVRLLETQGLINAKYSALSHCWGSPDNKPLTTTKSSFQKHCEEIPWALIPKTFQDAVIATRNVGLQYLWIDSLCIIQDDHDDWLRESKKMGTVYERAELTFAASHAIDSHHGLFLARSPEFQSVTLPDFWNETEAVYATITLADDIDLYPENGSLNKRAWVTQEWLLSRRMIFYTKDQLIWSCKSVTQRETGEKCFNTARNPKWKIIIEQYSDRQLTIPTDRLIALEGLKSEYSKKTGNGNTYINGLWKDSLPDQLLWQVCEKAGESNPLSLPSWTWASVSPGVRFAPMYKAKNLCESIRLDTANILIIKARMKRLMIKTGWHFDPPKEKDEDSLEYRISNDIRTSNVKDMITLIDTIYDDDGTIGWAALDRDGDRNTIYGLAVMGSFPRKEEEKEDLHGRSSTSDLRNYWLLLLCRGTEQGVYRRVGIGKVYHRRWRVGTHTEKLTII
jgi:hypothetical protein